MNEKKKKKESCVLWLRGGIGGSKAGFLPFVCERPVKKHLMWKTGISEAMHRLLAAAAALSPALNAPLYIPHHPLNSKYVKTITT